MPNDQKLADMTAAASALGWKTDTEKWPETFSTGGKVWQRKAFTRTEAGDVLCANYENQHGEWLIVYND